MRLTPPFDLPAPGRRQTLYVVFDFAEPCVFSKQSLGPLYCNSLPLRAARTLTGESTPSPEVTGPFCRVPKRVFSLAPEDFLLAYLCRFAVRVPNSLLRGFSRQRSVSGFVALRPRHGTSVNTQTDLPVWAPYMPEPGYPPPGPLSFLRPPIVITTAR